MFLVQQEKEVNSSKMLNVVIQKANKKVYESVRWPEWAGNCLLCVQGKR